MLFKELERFKVEDATVIEAFNRLENIECELGNDSEILQREREIAWGVLKAAYPKFAINDQMCYEYGTNEVIILDESTGA